VDFCNAGQGMTLVITDADDAVQYHQGSQTLRGFFGSPKMSKGYKVSMQCNCARECNCLNPYTSQKDTERGPSIACAHLGPHLNASQCRRETPQFFQHL